MEAWVGPLAYKVLVADDAPAVRMTLERLLESSSEVGEIRLVEDGEAAVEQFRDWKPDVVFMDLRMPQMEGDQATVTMLMEEPDLKVVIVTGLDPQDEEVRRCVSQGVFDVIQKPIRREDIDRILRLIEEEEGRHGRIK